MANPGRNEKADETDDIPFNAKGVDRFIPALERIRVPRKSDGSYPEVAETKEFPLEDILSVISGKLVNLKKGLEQVHDVIHYMIGGGERLRMGEIQLLTFAVRDAIYVQIPELEKISLKGISYNNHESMVRPLRKQFGKTITLRSSGRSNNSAKAASNNS